MRQVGQVVRHPQDAAVGGGQRDLAAAGKGETAEGGAAADQKAAPGEGSGFVHGFFLPRVMARSWFLKPDLTTITMCTAVKSTNATANKKWIVRADW